MTYLRSYILWNRVGHIQGGVIRPKKCQLPHRGGDDRLLVVPCVRPKQAFRCFGISAFRHASISADAKYSAETGRNKFILPKQTVSAEINDFARIIVFTESIFCWKSSLSAETGCFAEMPKQAQNAETVFGQIFCRIICQNKLPKCYSVKHYWIHTNF